ncbi:hypothetical protein GKODMF_13260 [Candidatus Electrothrix gigas]
MVNSTPRPECTICAPFDKKNLHIRQNVQRRIAVNFSATLEKYLRALRKQAYLAPFTKLIRKIPGAVALYRWFQSK